MLLIVVCSVSIRWRLPCTGILILVDYRSSRSAEATGVQGEDVKVATQRAVHSLDAAAGVRMH